jgi:hypothetical protein
MNNSWQKNKNKRKCKKKRPQCFLTSDFYISALFDPHYTFPMEFTFCFFDDTEKPKYQSSLANIYCSG